MNQEKVNEAVAKIEKLVKELDIIKNVLTDLAYEITVLDSR